MDTTGIREGDEVRILSTNRVGRVYDINPNPNWREDEEYWAEVEGNGWSTGADPDDMELIRRGVDIPTPTLPTLNELTSSIASSIVSGWDISIDETDMGGEPVGEFLAYGTSATGARFGFRVTVSELEWADY